MAEVSDVMESEDALIARAQQALSSCNWSIGECAATWTQRYARGRTDGDFGNLIGLSGDQVYQRRRVWEAFADVREEYPNLKWSHFYVALNWDDASECLQWANEMESTVAEMKAWRRSQHGEDITAPADEEPPFEVSPEYLSYGTAAVRDVPDGPQSRREAMEDGSVATADEESEEWSGTAASAARESSQSEYAPFGKGARGPAPGEETSKKNRPSTEQIVTKACTALERAASALTPEVLEDFHSLEMSLQQRLIDAVEDLQSRVAGLS